MGSLDLSSADLGPSGIFLVARLLQNPQCSLESLDVSGQPVGPEGVRHLVAAANATAWSLRVLRMKSCSLGDDGALELEPLIQSEHLLEELDIQNNFIGWEAYETLYTAA